MPWILFVCGSSLVLCWFLGLGMQLKNGAEAMPTNANIRSSNHPVLSMSIENNDFILKCFESCLCIAVLHGTCLF